MRDGKTKRQAEPEMKVDMWRQGRTAVRHTIRKFSRINYNTLHK